MSEGSLSFQIIRIFDRKGILSAFVHIQLGKAEAHEQSSMLRKWSEGFEEGRSHRNARCYSPVTVDGQVKKFESQITRSRSSQLWHSSGAEAFSEPTPHENI